MECLILINLLPLEYQTPIMIYKGDFIMDEILIVLTSSLDTARAGDSVSFSISLTNNSNAIINNITLSDPTLCRYFDMGVISIDGVSQPQLMELNDGIIIPTLEVGDTIRITFDGVVRESIYDDIRNYTRAVYTQNSQEYEFIDSNLRIILARPSIKIIKNVCPEKVFIDNETVKFTLKVKNTGNVPLVGVTITDILECGLTYVCNSTRINDSAPINDNPSDGIDIGILRPCEEAIVTFKAIVSLNGTVDQCFSNKAFVRGFFIIFPVIDFSNTVYIKAFPYTRYDKIKAELCLSDCCCFKDVYIAHKGVTLALRGSNVVISALFDIVATYENCRGCLLSKSERVVATFIVPVSLFTPETLTILIRGMCFSHECKTITVSANIEANYPPIIVS